MLVVSCSTKKNTGLTRFWHSFNARYNTYYNGKQAYIDASVEKENGNKDNFTEQLPLYTVGNKSSREIGKSNYDIAITKSQKVIQLHSIKVKPSWNKDRKKTEKDIEWLSRREYNPFLWKAWMLMGRSQFYKGEFDEAAATFAYMSRLYKTQPAIYGKAQAWLAKCYIENNWLYNAEDIIRNISRDSIDWRAKKEWDYTLCDYYLRSGDLPQATQYMHKVIKHEMRSKQRAREYYILGQIEAAQGHKAEAYKAFKKVLRQHPDYEHRFNANIAMTEVMASGQSKSMISRLKRMARNDNNKEYLDQIYYAIGNIYLADKDTTNAIEAYEKGNKGATRNGIEKGVLLLHLGDLYWAKEKYSDAKRCYGEAIGLLDKDRKDYAELSERSKVLDELVPYTDAVQLQDSLQMLSKLPKEELNKKIDEVIEALKKKEKEEADKKWEEEQAKNGDGNDGNNSNSAIAARNQAPVNNTANNQNSTIWYFYNASAVSQGKQSFIRQWGKRENVDDWQRSNKTVVGNIGSLDSSDTPLDSAAQAKQDSIQTAQDELEAKMDSAVNDPHKREYYLAQIPFTDEQKVESDKLIKDGLFHSAIIFKDKLGNIPLSEKAFRRLEEQYPDFEPKDEAYYHLFLLYSRKGDPVTAQRYVDSLKTKCPDSKWTVIVTDPYFYENARFGKQIEDSLYGATYNAFKADSFKVVYDNAAISEKRFSLGDNRDRFIFIYGLTKLNDGNVKECLTSMETVVKDYPQSPVSEMAGMIINGVKAGRRIYGAKFDLSDVWNRRTSIMDDSDSLASKGFSSDRNCNFLVALAYIPDSLGQHPGVPPSSTSNGENQLLFQLARYNFTNFLVRSFDISIEDAQGMHHMIVSGFRNFDEARQYAKVMSTQENIKSAAKGARMLIISQDNLNLIGGRYSYNDYDTFYVHHFAPLTMISEGQIYESVPVKRTHELEVRPILPTEEVAPKGAMPVDPKSKDEDRLDDSNSIAIPKDSGIVIGEPGLELKETKDAPLEVKDAGMEIVPTQETKQKATDDFVVPTEENKPQQKQSAEDTIILDDNKPQQNGSTGSPTGKQSTDDTIIIDDNKPQQKQSTDDTIIIDDNKPQQNGSTGSPTGKQSTDDTIIIDDNKPQQNGSTGSPTGKQSTDDTIIIDDSKPQQKKSLDKVEDEYFELDGF